MRKYAPRRSSTRNARPNRTSSAIAHAAREELEEELGWREVEPFEAEAACDDGEADEVDESDSGREVSDARPRGGQHGWERN